MSNNINTYRVSGQEKDSYYVIDSDHKTYRAEIKGKLRLDESLWPAIGDWVFGSHQPGDWVLIEEVLQRRNALQRQDPYVKRAQIFASNVDYMFVVTSANQDFNENRLERYLAMAASCDIEPVIVVNKIDLVENFAEILQNLAARISTDILTVSALKDQNKEAFSPYLKDGKTAVFVGSSGVGKSSLVNWLLEEVILDTGGIREDDDRGRHTTTRRSLHFLKSGAVVIDTPGIRSLILIDAAEGVSEVFSDIEELGEQCKFSDCKHQGEPGCQIERARQAGEITEERWQSYEKLKKETAYAIRKSDRQAQQAEKRKWINIHKEQRRIKNEKNRR